MIDSHTGGEPTRVVIAGGPELGGGPLPERRDRFREHHDRFRSAVVHEPRGGDAVVGALLTPSSDPSCAAGVIFFNNVGYLGMCVHGTIGVAVTLAHLGRLGQGVHHMETPVGVVSAELHASGEVTVENVPAYRQLANVALKLPDSRSVSGDVAWGGNWFFLTEDHGEELRLERADELTRLSREIRRALSHQGITGVGGAEIDHIELFGPPSSSDADSRSFVLCPGGAYDRSPCGTGTSAKLACLAAEGRLAPGETWRQESIIGSIFEGSYQPAADAVIPRIRGSAFITADAELRLNPADPLCWGIRRS